MRDDYTEMTVREAYLNWQNQLSDWSLVCCSKPHHFIDHLGRYTWKPDSEVCKREIAWRNYVRLRDCNPHFPFNEPFH
jgi:hypothetical protein